MPSTTKKRKPGRPKATESAETMTHILRIAAYQFMEHGFEKVSLAGVAKTCGVTKASVYYYFSNKSELFTAALLQVLKIAYNQSARIVESDAPLQDRLLELATKHMSNAHVEFETMMREASPALTEEQIRQIRDSEGALHRLLEQMFKEAIEEGEIAKCDPLLLSHAFIAMLTVRNRKEIINEHKPVEQAASEIVQLLMNGISPRDSRT